MVIVWRLRWNIIRIALCWVVWHNVHSQQHTYVSSSCRSSRLGLSHWDPYAVCRGSCLELYYCIMVEWCWWDSSLIWKTNWFSSVLWHCWFGHMICKNQIVPEMTYNVLSGTSSLYTATTYYFSDKLKALTWLVVFQFLSCTDEPVHSGSYGLYRTCRDFAELAQVITFLIMIRGARWQGISCIYAHLHIDRLMHFIDAGQVMTNLVLACLPGQFNVLL